MTGTELDTRSYEGLRARCLRSVRLRIGPRLSRILDSEDVVSDSLTQVLGRHGSALLERHDDLVRCVLAVAELRIRGAALRPRRAGDLRAQDSVDADLLLEEGVEQHEAVDLVLRELYALPVDHHWVLMARDCLGVSWSTVTFALGRADENAARCLYQRARKTLAARLEASALALSDE